MGFGDSAGGEEEDRREMIVMREEVARVAIRILEEIERVERVWGLKEEIWLVERGEEIELQKDF